MDDDEEETSKKINEEVTDLLCDLTHKLREIGVGEFAIKLVTDPITSDESVDVYTIESPNSYYPENGIDAWDNKNIPMRVFPEYYTELNIQRIIRDGIEEAIKEYKERD